jgi:hypothetical protein
MAGKLKYITYVDVETGVLWEKPSWHEPRLGLLKVTAKQRERLIDGEPVGDVIRTGMEDAIAAKMAEEAERSDEKKAAVAALKAELVEESAAEAQAAADKIKAEAQEAAAQIKADTEKAAKKVDKPAKTSKVSSKKKETTSD